MAEVEYLVVKGSIVGNPEMGYEHVYWAYSRFPTISAARRWGMREFGHDDFNLAVVDGDRLIDMTWMGESRGDTHDDLAEIAEAIGLTFKPPPAASSEASP